MCTKRGQSTASVFAVSNGAGKVAYCLRDYLL